MAPILGAAAGSFLVYHLSHREKLELKHANMSAQLKTGEVTGIELKCWFSLLYTKGTRDCYLEEISLELDKHTCEKLRTYFEGYIKMSKGVESPKAKLEIGKPQWFGFEDFFPARRALTEEERKELDDVVQKLWHRYRIGWKDTYGKPHWKTIHQLKDIEKSFKKAL